MTGKHKYQTARMVIMYAELILSDIGSNPVGSIAELAHAGGIARTDSDSKFE
jgi:hypothetical protein